MIILRWTAILWSLIILGVLYVLPRGLWSTILAAIFFLLFAFVIYTFGAFAPSDDDS